MKKRGTSTMTSSSGFHLTVNASVTFRGVNSELTDIIKDHGSIIFHSWDSCLGMARMSMANPLPDSNVCAVTVEDSGYAPRTTIESSGAKFNIILKQEFEFRFQILPSTLICLRLSSLPFEGCPVICIPIGIQDWSSSAVLKRSPDLSATSIATSINPQVSSMYEFQLHKLDSKLMDALVQKICSLSDEDLVKIRNGW